MPALRGFRLNYLLNFEMIVAVTRDTSGYHEMLLNILCVNNFNGYNFIESTGNPFEDICRPNPIVNLSMFRAV